MDMRGRSHRPEPTPHHRAPANSPAQRRKLRWKLWIEVWAPIVVIGGLIAWFLTPEIQAGRLNANESAAIATLKNLSSSQSQFQASGKRDLNKDGFGEYGDFAELVAAGFLSKRFASGPHNRVEIRGYVFELHLPTASSNRQIQWHAYAWPASYGSSGKRTFFVSQAGDVLSTRNAVRRYSADESVPSLQAAYLIGTSTHDGPTTLAANATGRDGERWLVV